MNGAADSALLGLSNGHCRHSCSHSCLYEGICRRYWTYESSQAEAIAFIHACPCADVTAATQWLFHAVSNPSLPNHSLEMSAAKAAAVAAAARAQQHMQPLANGQAARPHDRAGHEPRQPAHARSQRQVCLFWCCCSPATNAADHLLLI